MPGMDGFEVTRRVRQNNTLRLLPIILVTSLRETEDRIKGIEAGCDDFISKPVDKMELLARVKSLLKVKVYNDSLSKYRKELESEVTRRKQVEAALVNSEKRYRELSIIDELTQLGNSRFFYSQLKIEIDQSNRYKHPLTLILLDLDDFKIFNDTYGHVEGDQVLFRLGQIVKKYLRKTDFAFRYGGEEFTILLPMTTKESGVVTAEKIRSKFKKETFAAGSGKNVHVTTSIGLDQYKTQEDLKEFVHRVDQLMYQAKKNGKDRVCSV
jgi:diguanylate cyclase (GGDEF)-like protein